MCMESRPIQPKRTMRGIIKPLVPFFITQKMADTKIRRHKMKYLLRNKKVEYSGDKKQLIKYVREHYADDFWVQEYGKMFDTDFGKFKFAVECLGLELSDKMTNKEYNKTHRR